MIEGSFGRYAITLVFPDIPIGNISYDLFLMIFGGVPAPRN